MALWFREVRQHCLQEMLLNIGRKAVERRLNALACYTETVVGQTFVLMINRLWDYGVPGPHSHRQPLLGTVEVLVTRKVDHNHGVSVG
jgi:hypothetical protein